MSDVSQQPHLLIGLSADAENTWPAVPLRESPACLGRPEAHAAGPGYIDLRLESVSREHARIWRDGEGFVLEN